MAGAIAAARYVRTATGPTSGSYSTTRTQGYYDAARKTTPLVTKIDTGATPNASAFRLEEPGWWMIEANNLFSSTASIAICKNGFATGNEVCASGLVASPNVCCLREFSVLDQVQIAWTINTAAATMTLRDDNNHITLTFLGAI